MAGSGLIIFGSLFFILLKSALSRRKHKLYPVKLINLARARIIIHGGYIGLGISFFKLLYNPFAHNMIGQANGCMQTILGTPELSSSAISPARNQPSPY